MAAKRVESYLDYHKIGPLFEDLMAKLIKDMPEQPIPFLIKLLKKHSPEDNIPHSRPPSGSKSRSPMSSSMSLSGKPVPRQSLDDSREFKRSALAKSWAAPDTRDRPTSASKSREYDRPWLHGSKKGRGEQSHSNKENSKHGIKRSEERPSSWNHDTKVSYNHFDEWFEAENKKQKGAGQTGPTVQDTESKQSWHDNHDELDTSMDKRGIGYPLHVNIKSRQTPPQADADDLEGEEISFSRHRKTRGESSEGNSVASDSSSGRYSKKNARHASKEHRKQLESLLFNSSDASCQSRHHGKLSDEDKDYGTELLESPNELENEGVANPINSGYKVSKGLKSGASSQESVKVSICARCARIISGMPSDQRSDAASNFSNGTDDDFESVSQAGSMTGEPARIKWPSGFDSENDTVTPRKNKPMWEKPDTKPQKGKHMYNRNSSTFLTDLVGSPSPRPTSAASARSDDLFIPKPGKGWQQKSGEYSSDNDTDVNVKYGRSSPSTTRLAEGRPWARPFDSASDAGSEDWTLDRGKKVNFKSKGFRRSYLTDDSDH